MYQWPQRAPARDGARLPAGFIIPSQPTLSAVAPSGPQWLHELKHDGWRIIARKARHGVRLWTRHAHDVTGWFTGIAAAVEALPAENFTIDGEAVCLLANGHCAFHRLRARGGAAMATMVAFDLVTLDGNDLRRVPIEHRRELLEGLVAGAPAIHFSQAIEGEGPTIFEHACELGAEGIICKRRGSFYRSGRVDSWRKIKFAGFVRR